MGKKNKKQGISRRDFLVGSLATTIGLIGHKHLSAQVPLQQKKGATRVILLGTGGGPRPNKMRNQTSQVVLVNDVPYIVDCGGGVSRQLVFANVPLTRLRHIFITHHHSDHNLEYGSLIYNAWVSGFKGKIDAYGPPPLAKITKAFFETNEYDINIRIPDEGRPPLVPMVSTHEINKPGLVMEDENVKVTSAVVNHPPVVPSFAYRFDTKDRSIVFSGDTTQCDSLIELAKGADVLIHEVINKGALGRLLARVPNADRLIKHIVDSHTTTEEVGMIAKKAGVKKLVLTHFVPVDDPTITDEMWIGPAKSQFDGEVIAAKDLLEV
ncbi:MAG: MBL fold metallo-hydrolase [Syntrophorhabdaceae bacterium]|nr:MBL fold metallo-hydrolase [Syntrophorhabdaceae bacterium]